MGTKAHISYITSTLHTTVEDNGQDEVSNGNFKENYQITKVIYKNSEESSP